MEATLNSQTSTPRTSTSRTSRFTNPIWRAIDECPVIYASCHRKTAKIAGIKPLRSFSEYVEEWRQKEQVHYRN